MKTFYFIMSMLLLTSVLVCWYVMFEQENTQNTERLFLLSGIILASAAAFAGFSLSTYWEERYKEAIGLRPKQFPHKQTQRS